MKNILVIGFLLSGVFIFSQSNKAVMEISYETKIIPDSLNRQDVRQYEMTLFCNATESVYFNHEAKDYYNALSGKKESNASGNISTTLGVFPKYPKTEYSVYRSGSKITAFLPVGKYIFSFEEPELQWRILSDTKLIQGFTCRLAQTATETGDTFFAWYTEDLPIPDGPFRFKGLTGIVLEVYNKTRTIEISAATIKKSEEIITPIPYIYHKSKNKKTISGCQKKLYRSSS